MNVRAVPHERARAVIRRSRAKNETSGLKNCSELIVSLILILIAAAATAARTVVLGHDRRADALDLLVLLLDLLGLRLGVHLLAEALVVTGALSGTAHGVDVAIEAVLGVDALLLLLVLIRELLGLLDHLLDLLLRETALVVRDRDLLAL